MIPVELTRSLRLFGWTIVRRRTVYVNARTAELCPRCSK